MRPCVDVRVDPEGDRRAPSQAAAEPALAGVRDSGGEESGKQIEKPAFLRRFTSKRDQQERLSLSTEDPWDVPTFLRKQGG